MLVFPYTTGCFDWTSPASPLWPGAILEQLKYNLKTKWWLHNVLNYWLSELSVTCSCVTNTKSCGLKPHPSYYIWWQERLSDAWSVDGEIHWVHLLYLADGWGWRVHEAFLCISRIWVRTTARMSSDLCLLVSRVLRQSGWTSSMMAQAPRAGLPRDWSQSIGLLPRSWKSYGLVWATFNLSKVASSGLRERGVNSLLGSHVRSPATKKLEAS